MVDSGSVSSVDVDVGSGSGVVTDGELGWTLESSSTSPSVK